MKNTIFLLSMIITLSGCTEVVDVPLENSKPKLVVEAMLTRQKGTTDVKQQTIRLTTTATFYNNAVPIVEGASVSVKNSSGNVFVFDEEPKTGNYICNNFNPELNETYTLEISTGGIIYTATETMKPVAPLKRFAYENTNYLGTKQIAIYAFFDDPADQKNFYMSKMKIKDNSPRYFCDEDKLFDGQEYFCFYQSSTLKNGEQFTITLFGLSEQYFKYSSILLNSFISVGGGLFETPSATVKGNVINTSNKADFPLGYFSLCEIDEKIVTVEM